MSRLDKLLALLDEHSLDAILVGKPVNVRYFSGFTGDSTFLIIARQRAQLITDGRYDDQARLEAPQFEIVKQENGLFKMIAERLKASGLKRVGFEGNVMTFDEHAKLLELLPDREFVSIKLDSLRQVKDADEIERIRRACSIADRAFDEVLNYIRAGVSEIEIAAELEHLMRRFGSERAAFETIAASGLRGAYPHARATEKLIAEGEFVTLDFGAVVDGYHSDITRTVVVGRASEKQLRLYSAVSSAHLTGLRWIRLGVSAQAIDRAVRFELSTRGLDKYFTHGLGHGVGLEIHEEPRLSKLSDCEALLENMIVTDEPGVYIEGFGGLRIEDTVRVTSTGDAETLTKSPRHVIEL